MFPTSVTERRRAYTIQKMHANRKNTSLPNAIPSEAALQYANLIEMDEQGNIAGFSLGAYKACNVACNKQSSCNKLRGGCQGSL